jgi:small subunit ribosomal protein S9
MVKKKSDTITISGKRKTAIARASIKPGTGIIRINKRPLNFLSIIRRFMVEEPLRIASETLNQEQLQFDISVNVIGGGVESQIEASRLAIARAIIAYTKSAELKKKFTAYDRSLLVADVRRKEQYKPNDSKARAKRQKSYR